MIDPERRGWRKGGLVPPVADALSARERADSLGRAGTQPHATFTTTEIERANRVLESLTTLGPTGYMAGKYL